MDKFDEQLMLKDRPRSRDVSWLKWLAALAGCFAVVFICVSLIAEFTYLVMPGEGESPEEIFVNALYETTGSIGSYLFILSAFAALLWLCSKAIDRLDLLVWMKADNDQRKEIISLRENKNA